MSNRHMQKCIEWDSVCEQGQGQIQDVTAAVTTACSYTKKGRAVMNTKEHCEVYHGSTLARHWREWTHLPRLSRVCTSDREGLPCATTLLHKITVAQVYSKCSKRALVSPRSILQLLGFAGPQSSRDLLMSPARALSAIFLPWALLTGWRS